MKIKIIKRNEGALDPRLPWRAKGLLYYCLTTDDKPLTLAKLVAFGPDGSDCTQRALHELSEWGYANLDYVRDERGRMKGKTWTVYDHPQDFSPTDRKPHYGHRQTD